VGQIEEMAALTKLKEYASYIMAKITRPKLSSCFRAVGSFNEKVLSAAVPIFLVQSILKEVMCTEGTRAHPIFTKMQTNIFILRP